MHNGILVGIITFAVFFLESLLHYNIGKNSGSKRFYIQFPNYRDFFRIVIVLGFFSFCNGCIVTWAENLVNHSD